MIVRQQFTDLYLIDALPAIDDVIMGRYSRFPEQYSQMYRMKDSSRSIEQTTEITGLGTFVTTAEGEDTTYDQPLQAFDKTYTHVQRSLGFKVSRIAADDDRWGFIAKLGTELGKSAQETIEVLAASTYNNAFTAGVYAGPDLVALCSTAHPLVGGGTQSNTLAAAADLDIGSLELALTDFRALVDHRGKKLRLVPNKLVVAPASEFLAAELLGGTWRSDTAEHTLNAFRKRSNMPAFDSWFVYDYLTDPDAWFILSDLADTEMRFYWRERFNTAHEIHFDSRSIKTAGWMRFSFGFSAPWGVYGSPGV